MVSDTDLELQETVVILKFELPTVLLRFCPVCGYSISEDFQLKEIQDHFSECLGVETSIAVKSSKDVRKFRKDLKCRSCDKRYGNNYESVEVSQQLEDVEKRAEDRSERTENGFEFVSTEVAKTVGGSEDIEDGLRLEAVEEKEDEHHQLDSGSENHPRSNPSREGSQEVLLDKGGGNFDHIDEAQTILPVETKPVSEVGKPISKTHKPVSEIRKPVSEIRERHLDSVHLGNKVHSCSYCTKAFKDKTSLRHHVQGHTDARPFSCKTCSKSFRRKESLQYHENTHLNIKSFICSKCAKSFKNLRDLKHHEKIIHCEETGQSIDVSGLGLLPGMQTISVKTEKYKTEDDVITTKTVYVMEPDVPGGSSTVQLLGPGSPYTLGVPQLRSDKEVHFLQILSC
ncbi:zinc finger and SCAN domain-containing protein 12 [Eurytemora carolleeae]|uniref:zinc finger and SCAN domain-containing protein 12 n=1 Tax=Eurytemora carolleeae TaxID=1294199 RepID=UPI000C76AFD2|nr:zinc finger and SCAN domain-containing protein 12 [Eurytemora carolleeae]|eukprot:XP_023348283.1 zinc finger and SCAN domain-containing protein 12-like [Eurytemora affinis]